MYVALEPNTFLGDLLRLLVRKLSLHLITPAVRKLMLDMPVPDRLSNLRPKGSDHVNPCYTDWVKIEEVQSKIILHSVLNVD